MPQASCIETSLIRPPGNETISHVPNQLQWSLHPVGLLIYVPWLLARGQTCYGRDCRRVGGLSSPGKWNATVRGFEQWSGHLLTHQLRSQWSQRRGKHRPTSVTSLSNYAVGINREESWWYSSWFSQNITCTMLKFEYLAFLTDIDLPQKGTGEGEDIVERFISEGTGHFTMLWERSHWLCLVHLHY